MATWLKRMAGLLLLGALCAGAASAEISYPADAQTLMNVNLREGVGTHTIVLEMLVQGTAVTVTGKEGEWYAVEHEGTAGYIRGDLLRLLLADGTPAEGQAATTAPQATPTPAPTASGAATATPAATATATQGATRRILRYGAKGEDVRELQQKLSDLGYFRQSTTGNFYSVTQAAVVAFQRANGLSVDGVAGPKTYEKLYGAGASGSTEGGASGGSTGSTGTGGTSAGGGYTPASGYPMLRIGSRGDAVRALQQALKNLGYAVGSVDGIYGAQTAAAVRSFQQRSRLAVDGIAGVRTQQALQAAHNGGSTGSNSGAGSNDPSATQTTTPTSTPAPSGTYRNLQKGSTGEDVTRLQTALKQLGYYSGEAHGTYDDATRQAVIAFQTNNDTGIDGIAGSATQRILYEREPRAASEGPVVKETLAPGVGQMQGPSKSSVKLLHWFNDVKPSMSNGQLLTVYDPASGLGWKLRIYARGNHCDAEPLTSQDTAIMYKAFGNATTWNPKPVYVNLPDGRWSLASTHNVPHLTGSIKDNDFDGHLCVHFYRDMEEAQRNDPNYGVQNQNVIRNAWAKL